MSNAERIITGIGLAGNGILTVASVVDTATIGEAPNGPSPTPSIQGSAGLQSKLSKYGRSQDIAVAFGSMINIWLHRGDIIAEHVWHSVEESQM